MPSMYQTLEQFLNKPFNQGNKKDKKDEYEKKFQMFKEDKKISITWILVYDDAYYYHIKVPSESHKGVFYDVVLQFFTDQDSIKKEVSVKNYYIKFFSNSPSFVYKYATLYKQSDYLIESLFNKFDVEALDILPEKTNVEMEMMYDKSIYFACRFLQDRKSYALTKLFIQMHRIANPEKFFEGVSDVTGKKEDLEMSDIKASLDKELSGDKKQAKKTNPKKVKSTKPTDPHRINKITGSKSTSNAPKSSGIVRISSGGKTSKIKSTKSTKK